jgi:hypothetical protein
MRIIRGADERVIGDIKDPPKIFKMDAKLIAVLFWGNASLLRGILYFLAVLIHAGQKKNIIAALSLVPGRNVGRYGGVGVPDVRLVVDVIDWGGDKEFFHFH